MEAIILYCAVFFCLICVTLRAGFIPVRFLSSILVAEALANFLKRAIFLLGPQSDTAYHAAQLIQRLRGP